MLNPKTTYTATLRDGYVAERTTATMTYAFVACMDRPDGTSVPLGWSKDMKGADSMCRQSELNYTMTWTAANDYKCRVRRKDAVENTYYVLPCTVKHVTTPKR